jgi:hypothetical protein
MILRWRQGVAVAMAVLVSSILPITALADNGAEGAGQVVDARIEQPGGNPVTPAQVQQYAERERQSQGQEQFAGGDDTGIYIGGGALLILVVVLLVLLLR